MPRIQDVFHRRKHYAFVTKVDLTLCYYTYMLEEESSWLCIIVTPFGKFHRLRLPMGLCPSPDWSQAAIEEIFQDLLQDHIECFIDDIGMFTPVNQSELKSDWLCHLELIDIALKRLEDNGFTVNPQKCAWAVQETEFIGHWMTPIGIKPVTKKIDGIFNL